MPLTAYNAWIREINTLEAEQQNMVTGDKIAEAAKYDPAIKYKARQI